MNIGVTNNRSFKIDDGNGGKKDKSYLEMSIRPPFMPSATFTITKNKNADNENAPDFLINYSFNRNKEKYPRARVGALWNSTYGNENTPYIRGHIESPLFPTGKIYISIFAAKAFEGNPAPTHRHDVVWSPPQQSQESSSTNHNEYSQEPQTYQAQTQSQMPSSSDVPVIDIDEDEIPF